MPADGTPASAAAANNRSEIPELTGQALAAVQHRDRHMQIIAGAGSGKTEFVSERVADLLPDGAQPEAIVAIAFTERAAAELKSRIEQRVEARLGRAALDRRAETISALGALHRRPQRAFLKVCGRPTG